MKFPYQLFRGSYYPIIPVTMINNEKKVNTSAIVDSGASISIYINVIIAGKEIECKVAFSDELSTSFRYFYSLFLLHFFIDFSIYFLY